MTMTIAKLLTIMMVTIVLMVLIRTGLTLHLHMDIFRLGLTTLLDFNFTTSLLYNLLILRWRVLFHVLHTAAYT